MMGGKGEKQRKNGKNRVFDVFFAVFLLVGRGRFELPKSETSDLQSDPFGHSGIFPYMKLHRRAPRCLGGQGRASLLRLRNQTAMRFLTMELVIGIEPTTC